MCNCLNRCFFFKQKTAYEMRISDWSSDVCSSDLLGFDAVPGQHRLGGLADLRVVVVHEAGGVEHHLAALGRRFGIHLRRVLLGAQREGLAMELRQLRLAVDAGDALHEWADRKSTRLNSSH